MSVCSIISSLNDFQELTLYYLPYVVKYYVINML